MKNLYKILLFVALITKVSLAHPQSLPKKGSIKKTNIKVHGAPVSSLEVRYNIDIMLGEPTEGGSYKWNAGAGTDPIFLTGACEPQVYIQLKYIDSQKRELIGYFKLSFYAGGASSGKEFVAGGLGSPPQGWSELMMSAPGNKQYWPVESAKILWKYGQVTDFFTVDSQSCVNQHKSHTALLAKEQKAKLEEEARLKKDNESLRKETQMMIGELPAEERAYFQSRLSSTANLAPQHQKASFEQLQKDVSEKNQKLFAEKERKTAQNAQKMIRENGLETQINSIQNPADRQLFQNELQRLKTGRESASENDYHMLQEAVLASRNNALRIAEQNIKYNETIGTMSEDHKGRQEPLKRQQEMAAIQNDRTLTNEEKLRRMETVNQQLQLNKAVLSDDEARKERAQRDIDDMNKRNTQSAIAQGATMGVLGAGLGASINNANVTDRNVFSSDKKFHFSVGIGLAGIAYPTPVLKYVEIEKNDGTGGSFAGTTTEMSTGYQSSFATGFNGNLSLYPFTGEKFSFGVTASAIFAPMNFVNTVMGWLESETGDATAGTTGESTEEIEPNNLNWNVGGNFILGGGTFRGLLDLGYGGVMTSYNSNAKSRLDLVPSGYRITTTKIGGSTSFNYVRLLAGFRIGDMEDEDAVIIDVKGGKDLILNQQLDSDIYYLNAGQRQIDFIKENFPVSSPWMLSISGWKQHRYTASVVFGTGYFEQSASFWENSSVSFSISRTFDWRK